MRRLDFGRMALCSCAAAAMLAGCGGSQPLTGAPGATARTSSLPRPAGDGDLLYVPGRGNSYVLAYPGGQVVGTISGGGEAACSDASGEVFLVQGLSVTEYTHGATTPSATLTIPGNLSGGGCSVDPVTGNLAVTYGASNVAIYPNAQGTPTTYHDADRARICGYDNQGNLFVDGSASGDALTFSELPSGGASFTSVAISPTLYGHGWQVQWDGSHMAIEVVGDGGRASVYRLAIAGSAATIAGTTRFRTFSENVGQSWIAGNRIFMPFGRKSIDGRTPTLGVWKYPAGGKPTVTFKGINGDGKTADVYGAALSVAPH